MSKFYLIGALIAAAFLAGRHSAPEKIKIETHEVEKIVEKLVEQKASEKVLEKTEIKRPDGTVEKHTRYESKRESQLATSADLEKKVDEKKEIQNRSGVLVGALIGLRTSQLNDPLYGIHVSKEWFLGIHAGVWGLTSPSFGLGGGIFVGVGL